MRFDMNTEKAHVVLKIPTMALFFLSDSRKMQQPAWATGSSMLKQPNAMRLKLLLFFIIYTWAHRAVTKGRLRLWSNCQILSKHKKVFGSHSWAGWMPRKSTLVLPLLLPDCLRAKCEGYATFLKLFLLLCVKYFLEIFCHFISWKWSDRRF